jgi:hypothetical protein
MKLWYLYIQFLKLMVRWALYLDDTVGVLGAAFSGAVVTSPMVIVPTATGMIFGFEASPGQFVFPLEITIAYFLLIFLPLVPAVFLIWQIATESMSHTLNSFGMSGDKIRNRMKHWSRKVC